jgi:hypothetical protein
MCIVYMEVARAAVFIRRIYSLWQSIDNFHRTDGRRSSDLARDVLSALIFSRRGKLATAVCCADVSCAFCCLQLQCRARVRHISINTFTPQVHSEEFFAGIQILSPNPMQLIEGRKFYNIQIIYLIARMEPAANAFGKEVNINSKREK